MQKQESKSKATTRGEFWTFWTTSIILACLISFLVRVLACISWGWFLATSVIFGLFGLFLLLGAFAYWKTVDEDNKQRAWAFVVTAILIAGVLGITYDDHYSTYQRYVQAIQRALSDSNKPSVSGGQSAEKHAPLTTVSKEGANYKPSFSDYIDAWLLAQIQAKEQMFSPSSAKFYGSATENVEYTGYKRTEDGWSYQFIVQAKVELENAYGVTGRYTMNCQLNRRINAKGEEHWSWSEVVFL